MEYAISEQMRAWGTAHGYNVDEYVEAFNDYLSNRSRKPYKDNDAAFRNCVRSDWFNLRRNARINQTFTKPAEYIHRVKDRVWIPPTDQNETGHWAAE